MEPKEQLRALALTILPMRAYDLGGALYKPLERLKSDIYANRAAYGVEQSDAERAEEEQED